jgi:hypothetical protein
MEVDQIHKKWASRYPLSRFKTNFKNMKTQKRHGGKKQQTNSKKKETEPWTQRNKVSKACTLLFKLFMDGTSGIQNMPKEKIWKSHESFQDYPLKDFEEYVNDIVEKTHSRKKLINEEEEAFKAYVRANPRPEFTDRNITFWDTHAADKLLEKDIADGTAGMMASRKDLWLSREEYQAFPLGVFRNHFYQERRKQLAGAYWQYKRNMLAQREHDKQVEEMKDEWHENIAKDVEEMMGKLNLSC